jgi:hypothetical protein
MMSGSGDLMSPPMKDLRDTGKFMSKEQLEEMTRDTGGHKRSYNSSKRRVGAKKPRAREQRIKVTNFMEQSEWWNGLAGTECCKKGCLDTLTSSEESGDEDDLEASSNMLPLMERMITLYSKRMEVHSSVSMMDKWSVVASIVSEHFILKKGE